MRISAPVRYVLFSLLGLVIVAGGVVGAIVSLRLPTDLAEKLPAPSVLLFWEDASREDLAPFVARFSELASLPTTTLPTRGALVTTPGGTAWLLVPNSSDPAARDARLAPGADMPLFASSPEALALLGEGPSRLADDVDFRTLRGAGVFLRTTGMAPGSSALTRLLAIFGADTAPAFAVRHMADGFSVVWTQAGDLPSFAAAAYPALSPAPEFTISAGDLGRTLQELPSGDEALRVAQLSSHLATQVGGNASWTYDILPLLRDHATLHMRPDGETGGTYLLAEGTADALTVERTLGRLHEGAATQQRVATVVERTYEGGTVGRSVTAGGANTETVTRTQGGWEIKGTSHGGSHGLFTARKGGKFLASTDEGWLHQHLASDTASTQSPAGKGALLAGGHADAAFLRSSAEDSLSAPGLMLPLLPEGGGVRWSVRGAGALRTLTVAW